MRRGTLLLAALIAGLPLLVWAQELVIIPRDQTVTGNLVRSGNRVDMDGTVTGDAILFGNDVNVNGTVEGDLLVFAQTLTVKGAVRGSVRGAAVELRLDGPVGRNVTVIGSQVTVAAGAEVQGSVAALAQTLRVGGAVNGSVDATAADATVSGSVDRDVVLRNDIPFLSSGGRTTIAASAVIQGALRHVGATPAVVASGARIVAGVNEQSVEAATRPDIALHLTWSLYRLLGVFLLGWLCLWLFRKPAAAMLASLTEQPWVALLTGLAALILVPVIAIIIAVTLIGAPISLALMGLYALGMYLSRALVGVVVGRWLQAFGQRRGIRLPHGDVAALLIGLLTLGVLMDVVLGWPYLGWFRVLNTVGGIVAFALMLWGLGGFAVGFWRSARLSKPAPTA